ncbi:transmembrane protein, putative (macronuclear) [Tetrahymena thermophila SB210]|uniref:Transmembrane protein, putative n=1 Tax=Tetrahymena thermophila (strain SB210) TaxID=312017 RepID=W7X243_TETTS|nr:transmembrane protein, putative [Tetrahymena thermophila SB210]EWS71712.1 transmembrane protein, putative [Tetrahymena thermophila SB210]|eukprot:XP_012655753.1 transmembrane protein, putative [Tetrahymena thermophila SB210]
MKSISQIVLSQLGCPQNCAKCDQLNNCIQCIQGYQLQAGQNICNPICQYGQYYNPQSQTCVSVCPYQYFNQDSSQSCVQFTQCPTLSTLGQAYYDQFNQAIQLDNFLYTIGNNFAQNDYSIKIFDTANDCQFQGTLTGHLSSVLSIVNFQDIDNQSSQKTTNIFSLSANDLIKWDIQQGKLVNQAKFGLNYYAPSKPYIDSQVVLLQQNTTYFGSFQYQQYFNNPVSLSAYITMYQLVHQLNIIGYAQDQSGILYSYSTMELVKYNSQYQGQLICSFNQNVQQVQSVDSSFLIILFQSSFNLQTYYRGECDDLTIQQNEQITNFYIVDDQNYIILVEFYTQAILYQVNEYDSISSNIQSLINQIIVNKQLGNIILLGQGLSFLEIDFSKNIVLKNIVKKNISQTKTEHTNSVIGFVSDANNNRFISYSLDGSFIIWQETVDQFSGLIKVRFVLQQFHPICASSISSFCPYQMQSLELAQSNLLIAQYVNDNRVYLFNYQYDAVWLNNTYNLTDPTLKLNNYHFLKKNLTLTLCNAKQIAAFNISTASIIYNKLQINQPYLYGAIDFQPTINGAKIGNYLIYIIQQTSSLQYLRLDLFPAGTNRINQSISKPINSTYYIQETMEMIVITPNFLYIMNQTLYIYNVAVQTPSAISYEPQSKNLIIFQANQKATYMTRSLTTYTAQRSFTFSSVISRQAVSANSPEMYFFYQNTMNKQLQNQIYALGPNLDIQMVVSFQNKITSLTAIQQSQKIYIGFQNGDIQSGYFNNNYLQNQITVASPQFQYVQELNRVYYFDKDIKYLQLSSNTAITVTSGQQQQLNGLIIDQAFQNVIGFTNSNMYYNFFIFDLNKNTLKYNITGGNKQGTTSAYLDTSNGYLISYYNGTNQFFVWKYPNITYLYSCQDHINIYNDIVSGSDQPSSIVYNVGYIFLIPQQYMILSTNNYGGIDRYFYNTNTSNYIQLNPFSKVFFDNQQLMLYVSYSSQISYCTVIVYDTNQLQQQYINGNSFLKDIQGVIFQGSKSYIYDQTNLNVIDRVSFKLLLTISSNNPSFQSVIISDQLNYVFVWNNQQVSKNSNIAIFSLVDGTQVFTISSYQQIDSGNIDTVVLDEDSQQLFITKDSYFFMFSFDLQSFKYSGYYLIGYDTAITQMQFLPIQNMIVLLDASKISFIRCETSINTKNNFRSIYLTMNDDYFQNQITNKSYILDKQNTAWSYDYQNLQQSYLFQLDQIRLSTQWGNNIYVILNNTLIQYDLNMNYINNYSGRFKNIWFDNNYIFLEQVTQSIILLNQTNLQINQYFTTKLSSYIQNLLIIQNFTEVIILLQNNIIWHINYLTGSVINNYQAPSTINALQFDFNAMTLMYIKPTSVQFFTNFTSNRVKYYNLFSQPYNSTLSNNITNVIFDYQSNQMIVIYKNLAYLQVLQYQYNSTTNLTLNNIVLISQIPLPLRTPDLQVYLNGNQLQIVSPWQAVFLQRKSLIPISYLRDNRYLKSITGYIPSDSQPQYGLVTSDQFLYLIVLNPSTKKRNILYSFQMTYPRIIIFKIQNQGQVLQFNIVGASNGVFFSYNFLLPSNLYSISANSIQIQSQCFENLGQIKYSYSLQNQLTTLQNSLNQLQIQLQQSLIYVNPTESFYENTFFQNPNNKIVYLNQDAQNNHIIQIKKDSFQQNYLQNLQISNMIFDISNANNVGFNQNTVRITFQNITISSNGDGFSFDLYNLQYLVIENFQINDIQLQNNSKLFSISNCSQVYFNNFTISNVVLKNQSSLFEFINSNNIFINNLTINNLVIDSNSNTSNVFHLFNLKYIQIQNCNFFNISSQNQQFQTNFLFSEATKQLNLQQINYLNIERIPFISFVDSYKQDQYLYQITHNFLSMSNINATQIQNLNSSLINFVGNSFIVKNSYFNNINCNSCLGGAIYTKNAVQFKLSNSSLYKINAFIGGAIYITDSNYNEIVFENCNFISNSAIASGGAIYLQKSDLKLHNSTFIQNQALVGGAIRYTDIEPLFAYNQILKLTDDNNTFVNNTGTIHTNNFGSYTHSIQISSENSAMSLIASRRQLQHTDTQSISNDFLINEYKITEFQSGGSVNFTFRILDLEGNPVNFNLDKYNNNEYPDIINQEISSYVINANTFSEEVKLFGQQSTNYQQFNQTTNSFLISDLSIYSLPQTENLIYIQVPSIQRLVNSNLTNRSFSQGPFYSRLVFQFRKCVAGEIYQESNKLYICSECKDGFYSLVEPKQTKSTIQNCQRCPDGASDCYRNTIKLKEGYWRSSNNTDSIVYCSNQPSNCNGDESKGYCKEGNFGPLCEMCDNNGVRWGSPYMSNGKYGCVKCSTLMNNSSYILPSAIAGIIMLIYLIFSIKIAINISENIVIGFYLRCLKLLPISKSAYLDTTNMNIKSMMNYMQLAKLVNTFQVQLPSWLQILPQYLGSPVDNFLYTFDCYLNKIASSKIPLIYLRTVWTLVMPFLYIIGMSILYFIFVKLKWAKFHKNHLISGLVFLIYFLQSNMVSNLLSVMACREIDNQKYILADITYSCYTKTHIQYIFTICIPGLLLWAVILPVLIIKKLSKNKNNLENSNIRIPYGFLYQDYKQQYYYWEFVRSYLKIIIIVIMNFYGDPYNNKLVIAAVLFLLYLVLLQKAKPYNMIYYQQVDKRSMVVLIIIILMNIFLYNKPDIIQQQLFYIIVLGIDNLYQAYLVFEVVKNKLIIIYKYQIRSLKLQLLEYFPMLKKYIKIDTKSTLGVFYYWRQIRKEIIEMKKKKVEQEVIIQQHITSVMCQQSNSGRIQLENHQSPHSMFSQQDIYSQRNIGSFLLQDKENDWLQSNINSNSNLQNHVNISSAKNNNTQQIQKSAFSNIQENNINSKNVQDDIQDMQIIQRKKSLKSQKESFQIVSIIYKNLRRVLIDCDQININILSSQELNKQQQINEYEPHESIEDNVQKNIIQQQDSQQLSCQVQDQISIQIQQSKEINYKIPDLDSHAKQQSKQSTDSQGIDSSQEQKQNSQIKQYEDI